MEAVQRQTTCERCGAGFSCTLNGPCWCGEEEARLPLPTAGEGRFSDCLCRACLRELAAQASSGER